MTATGIPAPLAMSGVAIHLAVPQDTVLAPTSRQLERA
jgi:hypothetical protein